MMRAEECVKLLPFWNDMSACQQREVLSNAFVRHYDKEEILCGFGEKCENVIFLIEGRIRVYVISEDGREITLFKVLPEDGGVAAIAGPAGGMTLDAVAEVDESSEVLAVRASVMRSIAHVNLNVKCYFYQKSSERFAQIVHLMQDVILLSFHQRLARFFVSEYERTGSCELKMTQEEIARNVNSAREVVARMLHRFSVDGLVYMRRGCIYIKDIDALRLQM